MYFSQRQLVSQVGSSFINSALPLLVFKLIGSATNLALSAVGDLEQHQPAAGRGRSRRANTRIDFAMRPAGHPPSPTQQPGHTARAPTVPAQGHSS